MRTEDIKRFDALYTEVEGVHCAYCGEPVKGVGNGSQGDHIPPISSVRKNEGNPFGEMKKVPCCKSCNSILGDKPLDTLELRQRYVQTVRDMNDHNLIGAAIFNMLSRASERGKGDIITPDSVGAAIAVKVEPAQRIMDPVCGTGTLIIEMIKRAMEAGATETFIETYYRGYDIREEAIIAARYRLNEVFPKLDAQKIFKTRDFFTMNEKFDTIIMNPPWSERDGSYASPTRRKQKKWKVFADAAAKLATKVIIIAPPSSEFETKEVLMENILFDGGQLNASVVNWTSSIEHSFDHYPKFDVRFRLMRDYSLMQKGRYQHPNITIEGKACFTVAPFIEDGASSLQIYQNKAPFFCSGIRVGGYMVTGSEASQIAAYFSTAEGIKALSELHPRKKGSTLQHSVGLLNKAFSNS